MKPRLETYKGRNLIMKSKQLPYLCLSYILAFTFLVAASFFEASNVSASNPPKDTLPIPEKGIPYNIEKPYEYALPEYNVNVSNMMGNESEVSIDVNPTNRNNQVIVGHAPDFQTMNTFFTLDGGQTWTPVPLGDAEDGLTSTFRFDPTVAFDDNGNLYVGYGVRTTAGGGNTQRTVVVCRSTDGGQTYPQCTQLATNIDVGGAPGNDKWHLATGRDPFNPNQQNVYMAWTQNVQEQAGVDQRIVVSGSTNGGATFSIPLIIADDAIAGVDSALFADPAVGPNGELYVAWHDLNSGQVLVDVSLDGGAIFGTDNLVTTSGTGFKTSIPPAPDRGVFVGPTVDVDRSEGPFNGRLYVTYTDLGPGGLPDTNVFVRFSDDMGTNWSARTLVNDDGGTKSQFLPWLDVDQRTGLVNVVWYDARNDSNNQQVEVFTAVSTNGGISFKTNILVSDGQSDQSTSNPNRTSNNYLEYIGTAILNCVAFPVWSDNSLDPADLDFFTDQVPTMCRDHFLSYKVLVQTQDIKKHKSLEVFLRDQFEEGHFRVNQPVALHNPADKNGEGIGDPETHLVGYKITSAGGAPKHKVRNNVKVENQFGELIVDTIRADGLLVPSAKDLERPVEAPHSRLDHYKCYRVKKSKGTPKFPKTRVTLEDQFTPKQVFEVLRPTRLCNPVEKRINGEIKAEIKDPDNHLMCYALFKARGGTGHERVKDIHVNNQFGPLRLDTVHEEELCVPSTKTLP
jgi:hypothetical protein